MLITTLAVNLSACGSNSNEDKIKDLEDKIEDLENQLDESQAEEPQVEVSEEASPDIEDDANEEASITDEEIFMQFMNGETTAIVDADFDTDLAYAGAIYDYKADSISYTFDITEPLYFEQLKSAIMEASEDNYIGSSDKRTSYAITNTLSGKPVLAVKFENLGIYDENDESYALFIFIVNESQLYLTYAYDSWARNWIDIYDNMVFTGYGSGGAGDSFSWCYYIDETGHYKSVYDMETLFSEWIEMYASYDLGMESSDSWSLGCIVNLLETADGNYYAYEIDESNNTVDTEQLNIFMSLLEAEGKTMVDDVEEVINAAYEANGISFDSLSTLDDWIQLN